MGKNRMVDFFENIKKEYMDGDVCMGEMLGSIPADGLSVEEAMEIYIAAMRWANGDKFYIRTDDGEPVEFGTFADSVVVEPEGL